MKKEWYIKRDPIGMIGGGTGVITNGATKRV